MALNGRLNPIETGGRLRGGLLSVARPLPASYDDWRQGVNFNSDCAVNVGYSLCFDPEDATDKTITSVGDVLVFAPFMLYSGAECSQWIPGDELMALARSGMERGLSAKFSRQLQEDASGSGSPSMNSVATDITPGSPADVTNTLSGLLSSALECGIQDLVFHANLRILPFLMEKDLLEWDDTLGYYRFGQYPFVLDDYGSTGPGAVDEADSSEAWIYVTGPIEFAVGDEYSPEHDPLVRQNDSVKLVERLGILRFDECCVQAALAKVS
jgi:hypothetical protein